ncbi:unnamed protein product [Diatraea saccharalis]|uniref:Chitin-binding type-2 domain-containing protein n=1 Tax=Diatraea saccharalis TaxID=40085 RepID=A0A9N9RD01_9NEOP|nr:unnamed protein product [Diatraea saccharalis]
MASATSLLLILFVVACYSFDEMDVFRTGNVQLFLRAMTNDTKAADTLNLPANATSIRENITDTFSCENRTYGYYADVDNECQVFHVCLPSQTPSGRNVTYRWSFICPKETIFNQEVLVCTRSRDAIPCEESPMFYDVNMEIGKVSNDSKDDTMKDPNKQVENVKVDTSRRNHKRPGNRKQNIIVQNLLQNVVDEEMVKVDEMEFYNEPMDGIVDEIVPVIVDMPSDKQLNVEEVEDRFDVEEKEANDRLLEERNLKLVKKFIKISQSGGPSSRWDAAADERCRVPHLCARYTSGAREDDASDDEYQKYIDLLPESEKQAFLNVIARRLFKEVNNKGVNSEVSGEISDAELDKHGDFVKKILQEETDNLRRNQNGKDENGIEKLEVKGVNDNPSSEDFKNIKHIDLTLRNGERLKRSSGSEKMSDTHSIDKPDEIPVKIIYDTGTKVTTGQRNLTSKGKDLSGEISDDKDIQVRRSRRGSDLAQSDSPETYTVVNNYEPEDETTEKNNKVNSEMPEDTVVKSDSSSSVEVKKPLQSESQAKGYTASIYEAEGESNNAESSDTDENDETRTTYLPTVTSEAITTEFVKPIKINNTTVQVSTATNLIQNLENNTHHTTEPTHHLYLRFGNESENVGIDKILLNGTSESKINTVENKDTNETKETMDKESSIRQTVVGGNTTINDLKNITYKLNNENNESYIESITELSNFTVNPSLTGVVSTMYKVMNYSITSNKTNLNNNTTTTKEEEMTVFKSLLKSVRSGLELQFEENNSGKDYRGKRKTRLSSHHNKPIKKSETYEVYEISADRPPFIKKRNKKHDSAVHWKSVNEDQPYYVPIYNYSPENAYYNSYNRLGPNHDEEYHDLNKYDIFKVNTPKQTRNKKPLHKLDSILRKFKFSEKRPVNKNRIIFRDQQIKKIILPIVVKKPKHTKVYFNPNDYLDLDYSIGRSRYNTTVKRLKYVAPIKKFPDSVSEEHVYNSMKSGNSPNFHRATAKILYGRHLYFHIPKVNKTLDASESEEANSLRMLRSSNYSDYDKSNALPDDEDIAVDYYFGYHDNYARSKENLKEKVKALRNTNTDDIDNIPENTEEGKNNVAKHGTVKDILSIDPTNAFLYLDDLLKYDIPLARSNDDDDDLKPYMEIIKEMIDEDSKALIQYDWLGTTIDIRTALNKLIALTIALKSGDKLDPRDMQLINYVKYLFTTSKSSIDQEHYLRDEKKTNHTKQKVSALPRNKYRKKEYLKVKGLLDRAWLYIRGRLKDEKSNNETSLREFQGFLFDIWHGLHDLHDALTNIAAIITYGNQRWYQHLKDLYLKDAQKKQILEVLLHMVTVRVMDLIETAAKNGLEDNFALYIENHEEEVLRTKEDFQFGLKVLGELKKLV